jgi:hypothetical protein
VHAFVGADRHRPAADPRQRLILAGWQRLLHQRDAHLGAFGEILLQIVRRPCLVGIDDEFGFRRRPSYRGNSQSIAVAAELDLEQWPVRRLGRRRRHRLGRPQRYGVGGGAGGGHWPSEQAPDALAAGLGLEVQ